jgi:hypothetical protein
MCPSTTRPSPTCCGPHREEKGRRRSGRRPRAWKGETGRGARLQWSDPSTVAGRAQRAIASARTRYDPEPSRTASSSPFWIALLTPPEDKYVRLDEAHAVDGAGLRDWLARGIAGRTHFPGHTLPTPPTQEARAEPGRDAFQLNLARLALQVAFATRRGEEETVDRGLFAIRQEVLRRERELRGEDDQDPDK